MTVYWRGAPCVALALFALALHATLFILMRRPASRRRPFEYKRLPWGILAGWPNALVAIGTGFYGLRLGRRFLALKNRVRFRPLFSERNRIGYRSFCRHGDWELGMRTDRRAPAQVQGR